MYPNPEFLVHLCGQRDWEAAAAIGDLTSDVTVLPVQFEGQDTWPQSPNLHWVMTMEALRLTGNKDTIFWMELDCDPIATNWADLLETDWRKGRQPFAGKIVPKPSRNAAGAIVYEPDDLMMMGCGMYPFNITQFKNWDTLVKGFLVGTNTEPFDVFMRGWMRQAGWTETDLIGDRWNTINYREGLFCDPGPTEFKYRDHSKTDVSGAVVVHGCKDGSLARLILEQGTVAIAPPVAITPPPAAPAGMAPLRNFSTVTTGGIQHPAPSPPIPAPKPAPIGNPEFEKQVTDALTGISTSIRLFGQGLATLTATVKEALTKLEIRQPTEEEAANLMETLKQVSGEPSHLEVVETVQPEPKTKVDIETIRGMVNGSEKAQRIGQLAKELKMGVEKLRKLITKKDSGLIIKKGYVRLATAA